MDMLKNKCFYKVWGGWDPFGVHLGSIGGPWRIPWGVPMGSGTDPAPGPEKVVFSFGFYSKTEAGKHLPAGGGTRFWEPLWTLLNPTRTL